MAEKVAQVIWKSLAIFFDKRADVNASNTPPPYFRMLYRALGFKCRLDGIGANPAFQLMQPGDKLTALHYAAFVGNSTCVREC